MAEIIVHPRVTSRHPELTDDDVLVAWENAIRSTPRLPNRPDEYVSVSFDEHGRLIEMVAVRGAYGDWLIFHAMTPPSKKTLKELDME